MTKLKRDIDARIEMPAVIPHETKEQVQRAIKALTTLGGLDAIILLALGST